LATRGAGRLRLVPENPRTQVIPSGVLAMLMFVGAELMLFAGMISGFAIVKAGAIVWPPPGQPRLPIEATAFNTAVLLASGGALWLARRAFQRDRRSAARPLYLAMALGAFFVLFQGFEWVRLIAEGLTLQSSSLGSFFYLIVGTHALHAVIALVVLGWVARRMRMGFLASTQLAAAEVFWYFVVGLWPVLYLVVYL
jgi:cytochrome c oxidase subunit 3